MELPGRHADADIMDTKHTTLAAAMAALPEAERLRLERLAKLAKLTPEQVWPVVARDGFAECEASVRADIEAEQYFAHYRGIDGAEVIAEARRLIGVHEQRKRRPF